VSDIDGRPLIPEVKQRPSMGILSDNTTYQVTGDWKNAYEALKGVFETKPVQKSEGIRPYTKKELDALENKSTGNFLEDLPPTLTQ
jgi:hypothetical protein